MRRQTATHPTNAYSNNLEFNMGLAVSIISLLRVVAAIAMPTCFQHDPTLAAQPYFFKHLEIAVLQTGFERDSIILSCTSSGCDKPLQLDEANGHKYSYQVTIISQSGQLGLALTPLKGPRLVQDQSAPIIVPMGDDGQGKINADINLALPPEYRSQYQNFLVLRAIEPPLAHLHIFVKSH